MIEPGRTAILFDAVGTLIYPCPNVAEAYDDAAQRFGARVPLESIGLRFREAFAQQESLDTATYHTGESRERQRWRTIISEVFPDADDPAGLFNALWDHFAQPQHWRVYEDVAACFHKLRAAGYQLGIASNFDARLDAICQGHAALAGVSCFVSSRLGFKKPSLEFFRGVERSLQLPAAQLVLIGDDLENDFLAAGRAGWQAILLNRDGDPAKADAAASIATLRDLI